MSNNTNGRGLGKGYYIALILCAAAIGITGIGYYTGTDATEPVNTPVAVVDPVKTPESTKPAAVPTPTTGKLATIAPVEGEVIADYAMEVLGYNQTTRDWRVHNGVDWAAAAGTPVIAAADGQVYTVYEDDRMGMTVVIRHSGGYTTRYSSLAKDVSVTAGQQVTKGQTIGAVGNTAMMESAVGDHVHFSVTKNDVSMDPMEFLK